MNLCHLIERDRGSIRGILDASKTKRVGWRSSSRTFSYFIRIGASRTIADIAKNF